MTRLAWNDSTCDTSATLCRVDDKTPTLPKEARLPINRCNLPAVILGSLTFQAHPTALKLDGVAELHRDLFARLDRLALAHQRAQVFCDYITVVFRLEHPEEIGYDEHARRSRPKANWLRVLRGWAFDPDGREAAVLKGWVESRFGLMPRHHGGDLRDIADEPYLAYQKQRAEGLYGTNALEAQLDLVYAFCQYEFDRSGESHDLARTSEAPLLTLHRGVNRPEAYEVLGRDGDQRVLLLNNVSSFSACRERAGEFGDYLLCVRVPTAKVLFHHGLIPRVLKGEGEYLVLGGVYRVNVALN